MTTKILKKIWRVEGVMIFPWLRKKSLSNANKNIRIKQFVKDFAVVLSLMRGFALCCVGCTMRRVSLGNLALLAFEPTILNPLPSLDWKKSKNQTQDEAKTGGGSNPYLGILRLILTPEPEITHPIRTRN